MSNLLKRFFTYSRRASFFIPFAIVLGFVGMATYNSFYENRDLPAGETEFSSMALTKNSKIIHQGKHLSLVYVNLQSSASIPETAGRSVEIKGYVMVTQATASTLKYKWILPDGVFRVRGPAEGTLDPTRVRVWQEVKIEVTGFDQTDKRVITLEAKANTSQQELGSTAVLSSRPQDSMEYLAPDMKLSVDQLAAERDL